MQVTLSKLILLIILHNWSQDLAKSKLRTVHFILVENKTGQGGGRKYFACTKICLPTLESSSSENVWKAAALGMTRLGCCAASRTCQFSAASADTHNAVAFWSLLRLTSGSRPLALSSHSCRVWLSKCLSKWKVISLPHPFWGWVPPSQNRERWGLVPKNEACVSRQTILSLASDWFIKLVFSVLVKG